MQTWVGIAIALGSVSSFPTVVRQGAGISEPSGASQLAGPRLFFKARPDLLRVANLPAGIKFATTTDIAVADFNRDGRNDIAVAWYANAQASAASLRMLTIFLNDGGSFHVQANISLYMPDPQYPQDATLRIFRWGTGCIAVGDFDGDGDLDLAVTPFFGDEVWFIENLGNGQFAPHLKFMYGYNSSSIAVTPARALAADFDGDGRDELVYLLDPTQHLEWLDLHFWKTDGMIADMYRLDWPGPDDAAFTEWSRGMAIADFDGDGRPDLGYIATHDLTYEIDPILTFWYGRVSPAGGFSASYVYPTFVCADVAAVRPDPNRLPGVLVTDIDGTKMQYWAHAPGSGMSFTLAAQATGYAGLSPNRGMAAAIADVDGDGNPDLVTKQKSGQATDANQIEITLSHNAGAQWERVSSTPVDTTGFQNDVANPVLRPRNLAVADLFGNTLPEIIAGFAASGAALALSGNPTSLDIAIWENSCRGDVNRDGRTDTEDLRLLRAALGSCRGGAGFNPDADLDRNGCIGSEDLALLLQDIGCQCCGECAGQLLGDSNCDGAVNGLDIDGFVLALFSGADAWTAAYGSSGCSFLCVNDVNQDGNVNALDIGPFIDLILTW